MSIQNPTDVGQCFVNAVGTELSASNGLVLVWFELTDAGGGTFDHFWFKTPLAQGGREMMAVGLAAVSTQSFVRVKVDAPAFQADGTTQDQAQPQQIYGMWLWAS